MCFPFLTGFSGFQLVPEGPKFPTTWFCAGVKVAQIICLANILSRFPVKFAKKTNLALSGELFTWGKGRYGRLGHGDSEDQLRPKFVEALLGYRVIDVACGE